MFDSKLRRIAVVYIALQFVIWAKSALFFAWFGHGRAAMFSRHLFSEEGLLFDFFFHETMHVAIGLLALLFGWRMQRLELPKLVVVVLVAVSLHNFAYWLTASHQNLLFSAVDFARDSTLLLAFVVAGFALKKILAKKRNQ